MDSEKSSFLREWGVPILIACGVVGMILWLVMLMEVTTESMAPTIIPGDKIVASNLPLLASGIKRYDLITFKQGKVKVVKRVIGLPGETFDLQIGRAHV